MAVLVNDVLKVVWQARVDGIGTRVQNVFYWRVAVLGDGDETNIAIELAARLNLIYGNIQDWFSADYILELIRITNDSQKTFVGQPPEVFAGGGPIGASTPAQIAVEVLARASALGHTARKYLGPCIEAAHTDGVLVALALTDFQLFAAAWAVAWVGGATTNTYEPVMVAHLAGGALGLVTLIDPDLHTVVPTARTQRRRIPGRGLS